MLVVAEREQLPVSEARTGVAEAWDTLFQRYQLPLYVYVFEWVHDEQASLDIVQETFTSAVRHLASLRDDAKFGSWLFGIAHQKCIQRWRKQSREHALLEEVAGAPLEFDDGPLGRLYHVAVLWNPIDDDFAPKSAQVLQRGVDFARKALEDPAAKLFVHCAAGVHRAPMMALASLCTQGYKLDQAMALVEARRPDAEFVDIYVQSVRDFLREFVPEQAVAAVEKE